MNLKTKMLPLGTTLYFVIESMVDYYLRGEPYHYEIVSGKISKISQFDNSRRDEYVVPTENRLGRSSVLEYARTDEIGKRAFLTRKEAEQAADKMSDNYEKTWGWSLKAPLKRPWQENRRSSL